MPSPVPRHLRTDEEESLIPRHLRSHVVNFQPDSHFGVKVPGAGRHRAKFAPAVASKPGISLAALYVQRDGIYYGLDNVDPWDEERDARNYDGPWPVVAHPPCARWCMLAPVNQARWGTPIGDDGGCFVEALEAVRTWGGVLEHPAYSLAWPAHDLPVPKRGIWRKSLLDHAEGWVTEISQSAYGHKARKRTWLYLVGEPFDLDWSDPEGEMMIGNGINSGEGTWAPKMDKKEASATPIAFRDVLIQLALTAYDRELVSGL